MGFLIDCPNCGARSYHEFWFGGEPPSSADDPDPDRNYEDVWLRSNVAGSQTERWYHWAGCRRWLTVERDTRDNTVLSVERATEDR
jgi:heterotetrameric sarcosine oxidase delta subunit